MTKDITMAEAVALGTVGFPLTIHRTISEGGESIQIHVGDSSVEKPGLQARAMLRELRAGCLPEDSEAADATAAFIARSRMVAVIASGYRARIYPDVPGRYKIIHGHEFDNGRGVIETPSVSMATTLAMAGFWPIGVRGNNDTAVFQLSRYDDGGADGAEIVNGIRNNTMPPCRIKTWYLACRNFSEIKREIGRAKAMLLLSAPGITAQGKRLFAYVREDSPGKSFDKARRFLGY